MHQGGKEQECALAAFKCNKRQLSLSGRPRKGEMMNITVMRWIGVLFMICYDATLIVIFHGKAAHSFITITALVSVLCIFALLTVKKQADVRAYLYITITLLGSSLAIHVLTQLNDMYTIGIAMISVLVLFLIYHQRKRGAFDGR